MKTINKIDAIPNQQFLQFQNGVKFLYLADTWWFGLTSRWSNREFIQAVNQRIKQGFTAIQLVVGVPPEIPFWSSDACLEGEHPFHEDYSPNNNYFNKIDYRIEYLLKNGVVPVIFGGWGYHIDLIGVENTKKFWTEIVRRYKDKQVIYCLCGEVDLFPESQYFRHQLHSIVQKQKYLIKVVQIIKKISKLINNKYNSFHISNRLKNWDMVAQHIKKLDKKTPLTVHPHSKHTASELFGNATWLDIDSVQSGHSSNANMFFTQTVVEKKLQNPFIDLEAPYEGIFDSFYGTTQVEQLLLRLQSGSAGYTYGAQGLWNLSTKKEPFLTHWGSQDKDTALSYQGAQMFQESLNTWKNRVVKAKN